MAATQAGRRNEKPVASGITPAAGSSPADSARAASFEVKGQLALRVTRLGRDNG